MTRVRRAMTRNILVWDIESVSDLKCFSVANGLGAMSAEEVRKKLGDKVPKHIYHSIACRCFGSSLWKRPTGR